MKPKDKLTFSNCFQSLVDLEIPGKEMPMQESTFNGSLCKEVPPMERIAI